MDDDADEFDDDLHLDEEAEQSLQQIEEAFQTQALSRSQSQRYSQHAPVRHAQPGAGPSVKKATGLHGKRRRSASVETVEPTGIRGKHLKQDTGQHVLASEVAEDRMRIEELMRQLASKDEELQQARKDFQRTNGEARMLRAKYNQTMAEYSTIMREKEENLAVHRAATQQFKRANEELMTENNSLKSFRAFEAGTNATHQAWSSVTASVARRRAVGQVSAPRDYSQSHSQTLAAAVGLTTPTRRNRGDGDARNLGSPSYGESPSSRRVDSRLPSSAGLTTMNSVKARKTAFPGFVNSFAKPILAKETQPTRAKPSAAAGGTMRMADEEVFHDRSPALPQSSSPPHPASSPQSEVRVEGRREQELRSSPSAAHTAPEQQESVAAAPSGWSDPQLRYLWAVKTYSRQQGFLASLILAHTSEPCCLLASGDDNSSGDQTGLPRRNPSTLQRLLRPSLPAECPSALRKEYEMATHQFLNTLSHGSAVDAEDRFAFLQEPMLDVEHDANRSDDLLWECVHSMDHGVTEVLIGIIVALRIMMAVAFKVGAYDCIYDVLTLLRSISIHYLRTMDAIFWDMNPILSNDSYLDDDDGEVVIVDGHPVHDAATSIQRRQKKRLELDISRIMIASVRHACSSSEVPEEAGLVKAKSRPAILLHSVVGMLEVLAYHTRHNDNVSLQCAGKLKTMLEQPGIVTALLDSKRAAGSVERMLGVLTQLCQHDSLWRVALASKSDQVRPHRSAVLASVSSDETALFEVLAKLLVDGRVGAEQERMHGTHRAIVIFLSQLAICLPDEAAPLVANSGPILAALIKCLQVDTDQLWIESVMPSKQYSTISMTDAVERICMDVRLMAHLYRDDDQLLAQKLASPASQLLLNGIRQYFVVALSRVAFQPEPGWMEEMASGHEGVEAARAALNETNDVAAELLELVLSPDEIEACWEAFAEDEEDDGEGEEGPQAEDARDM